MDNLHRTDSGDIPLSKIKDVQLYVLNGMTVILRIESHLGGPEINNIQLQMSVEEARRLAGFLNGVADAAEVAQIGLPN